MNSWKHGEEAVEKFLQMQRGVNRMVKMYEFSDNSEVLQPDTVVYSF